ncbi:MULE domain-containing protein, partial [Trichostrongylus colubriformis]
FTSHSTGRSTFSRKDVSHCSCFAQCNVNDDGTVVMKGCFGHIGHDVEPALLRLNETQKQLLKSLLEEHSLEYVIRRIRSEFPAKTSRLHFVTRGDLWAIIDHYGMRPGFRDNDDLTSLRLRAAENNPDDGIRLFEMPEDPSGKGFTLVIITPTQMSWLKRYSSRGISLDDTHGATRYNFKLATVMVADSRDRGLPAAFLLSGTMTAIDVEKLFKEIKVLMPAFNPSHIVTDEAPCFVKGFAAVFPNSHTALRYCRWHIGKTWERKVNELVEVRLRATVKKALKELLRISQLKEFEKKFERILAILDVEHQDKMAQYLRTNYLGRIMSWASFNNRGAVMDTSMLSERWHLRLKSEILHRNANSRVDCLVELLIRAVKDIADANNIMDRRRLAASSFRTQQTVICHRYAFTHYSGKTEEKIKLIATGKWEVQGKTPEEKFVVEDRGKCSCNTTVNVHCSLCGVCPYSYTCTCLDNRAGISCVHRHAVRLPEMRRTASSLIQADAQASTSTADQGGEHHVSSAAVDALVSSQERLDEKKSLRNKIQMAYSVVTANVNALVNSDADEAFTKLTEIHDLIDEASKIGIGSASQNLVIVSQPELSKSGRKPMLTKTKLYTRAEYRKKKGADRNNPGGSHQ